MSTLRQFRKRTGPTTFDHERKKNQKLLFTIITLARPSFETISSVTQSFKSYIPQTASVFSFVCFFYFQLLEKLNIVKSSEHLYTCGPVNSTTTNKLSLFFAHVGSNSIWHTNGKNRADIPLYLIYPHSSIDTKYESPSVITQQNHQL